MSTVANDVIIVTSSLTRDMTGKEDSHRGPAIRALCKITDVGSRIRSHGVIRCLSDCLGVNDAKRGTIYEASDRR